MPELPEVHALATDLSARLGGRTVKRLDIVSFAALKTFDPPASALAGGRVLGVSRHGKFLDIAVTTETADAATTGAAPSHAATTPRTGADAAAGEPGGETSATEDGAPGTASVAPGVLHIVIHLARAGWIRWREGEPPRPTGRPSKGPLAARLLLVGGQGPAADAESLLGDGAGLDITEAGTKKSLAIHVVRDPAEVPGIARLGPDPLEPDFTLDRFADILTASGRAQIKGVLRNQGNIAGIGNAYSDEILHVARMSPFKPAAMTDDEVARLYDAVQLTLRDAIARSDGLAASELKKEKKSGMRVHGRAGATCPVCGDTVREVIFHDSTLQYCPTCQTGGKVLADRLLSRLLK